MNTKLKARLALRQRADLLVANIRLIKLVFLRAKALLKEKTVTTP